jgi:hypothetical protein
VVAKTRAGPPAHTGSVGPFRIYFCVSENDCFAQHIELRNLVAGQIKIFESQNLLIADTEKAFNSIRIVADTVDAWYAIIL